MPIHIVNFVFGLVRQSVRNRIISWMQSKNENGSVEQQGAVNNIQINFNLFTVIYNRRS